MIKKIERPDVGLPEMKGNGHISIDYFNVWFRKYCEPVNKAIEEAVEVYQKRPCTDGLWHPNIGPCDEYTHKALLMGIEPIKQETCADIAREMVERDVGAAVSPSTWDAFVERYKAAIKREQGE